jgi:hypothetical protein
VQKKGLDSSSCSAEPFEFVVFNLFNACTAQFTCRDAAVILHECISLVFGLHHHCRGWVAAAGPVTNTLLAARKVTGPASN